MRSALFALSVLASVSVHAAERPDHEADRAAIVQLGEAYTDALLRHDGPGLCSLFISEGGMLVNVLSQEEFDKRGALKPYTRQVKMTSAAEFCDFVATTTAKLEPSHGGIKIDTDGIVGALYFQFEFFVDGKSVNRGRESWQVVKDAQRRKIASITYSSEKAAQN